MLLSHSPPKICFCEDSIPFKDIYYIRLNCFVVLNGVCAIAVIHSDFKPLWTYHREEIVLN